jgi:hypothetical protein
MEEKTRRNNDSEIKKKKKKKGPTYIACLQQARFCAKCFMPEIPFDTPQNPKTLSKSSFYTNERFYKVT